MSSGSELLVVPLLPVAVLALAAGGVFRVGNSAADALAAHQLRRIESAARTERARLEYAALVHRVEDARRRFGDAITPLRALDERDPGAVEQVQALIASTEPRLRAELARAGTAALLTGLRAGLAGVAEAALAGQPQPTGGPPAVPDPVVATVERVLGRLDTTVPAAVRAVLEARAADVLAASAGQASVLVADLREGVQRANERLAARRARLADLHERLDRYAGEAAEQARHRLYRAAEDPDPDWPALTAAVDGAIDRTVAVALGRYTAQAVREALQEAGCEVEEDFDVLLVEDGVAHVRPPAWDGLAVRIRRHGDRSDQLGLSLSVVAAPDAPTLDTAAEASWCGTLDDLLPALAVRGIRPELRQRTEIGAGVVAAVEPAGFPFDREGEPPAARRRRGRELPRARQVGRP